MSDDVAIDSSPKGTTATMAMILVGVIFLLPFAIQGGASSGGSGEVPSSAACSAGQHMNQINETIAGIITVQCSATGWASLTGFPSPCPSSKYVTAVGASLTCSSVAWNNLTAFPSGCSAGQFVTGVGLTLTCSSVAWSQLTSFPAACPGGQFVTAVGVTLTCGTPTGSSPSVSILFHNETTGSGSATKNPIVTTTIAANTYACVYSEADIGLKFTVPIGTNDTVTFSIIYGGTTKKSVVLSTTTFIIGIATVDFSGTMGGRISFCGAFTAGGTVVLAVTVNSATGSSLQWIEYNFRVLGYN